MDQNGSFPGETAGSGQAAAAGQTGHSLSVYAAAPAAVRDTPGVVEAAGSGVFGSVPDSAEAALRDVPAGSVPVVTDPVVRHGLTGTLTLHGAESLTQNETATVLSRLDHLIRWAQAQQAKTLTRMQILFRDEYLKDTGLLDPGLAFSLAAEEAATILHVPTNTAMMLMSEAGTLCTTHTTTLHALEAGGISYGHAQTVVDQSQNIPPAELPAFETQLLELAPEQTHTQFRVRARRLRENTYPETIEVRQASAFDRRRVALQPECDGMSWLSALLPAEKAQAFFTRLSLAARGEQAAGDPRTVDQLRTDILTDLLDGHDEPNDREDQHRHEDSGSSEIRSPDGSGSSGKGRARSRGREGSRARRRARARTEILVLINAETLLGADDQPAELHGYGPISPERARRMARDAAKWTPVERDPETEEILRVGRRRKVPEGLKQLLRVRDGTCRFPGCRTNAVISEIDHTKPWVQGGPTDHDNLEHLCRRHHMFKTKGFWKACQPSPGIIEWTSPGGRKYRTEPQLTLIRDTAPTARAAAPTARDTAPGNAGADGIPDTLTPVGAADRSSPATSTPSDPDDYGDNPPPF